MASYILTGNGSASHLENQSKVERSETLPGYALDSYLLRRSVWNLFYR